MKLTHTLTDAQGLALTQLLPRSLVYGEEALSRSVESIAENSPGGNFLCDELTLENLRSDVLDIASALSEPGYRVDFLMTCRAACSSASTTWACTSIRAGGCSRAWWWT